MPKVNKRDVSRASRGRRSVYPIQEWLAAMKKLKDGEVLTLVQGEDYSASDRSLRCYLCRVINKAGFSLGTDIDNGTVHVWLRGAHEIKPRGARTTKPVAKKKSVKKGAKSSKRKVAE